MRLRYLLAYVVFLMILFLEDYVFEDPPQGEAEFKKWGDDFHKTHHFPLYAIVLATKADSDVVSFVIKNHEELAAISSTQCCFIYFNDVKRLDKLSDFDLHQKWVYPVVNELGISYDCIPGILFFKRIDSGEYIYFSLKDKSESQIIALIRKIFEYLKPGSDLGLYDRLKKFVSPLHDESDPCTMQEPNVIALTSEKKAFDVINIIFGRFFPS